MSSGTTDDAGLRRRNRRTAAARAAARAGGTISLVAVLLGAPTAVGVAVAAPAAEHLVAIVAVDPAPNEPGAGETGGRDDSEGDEAAS